MSKIFERHSFTKKEQYLYSAVVSFGCVCAGTVLGWTSPVISQLKQNSIINDSEAGVLGSIVAIGAMVSALPTGYISNKLGCKTTLKYLSVIFVLGWILLATVTNLNVLYLARFLGGFASGAVCVCVPIYIGDIANVSIRGILGSFFQICFCAGILAVNSIGVLLTWQDLSLMLTILPLVYFFALFFVPDATKTDDAVKVKSGTLNLLKEKSNMYALIVALGLVTFQQLSGINAIIFYTSGIFAATGITSISPGLSAIIVAAVQLGFSCLSASLVEKLDRRIYLMLSASGMFSSLLMLGVYFHTKHLDINGLAFIPLLSLVLFIISFSVGYGPLPWLMLSELFASNFKSIGCGIATTFNWFLIFAVTCAFPMICAQFGEHITFYLFSTFNLAAVLFAKFCVPETRGKTSSEIQQLFQ